MRRVRRKVDFANETSIRRRGGMSAGRLVIMHPRDPCFEEVVRECFHLQGAMTALDATLTVVTPGRCEIALPFSQRVTQQYGLFHGGIISALADCAGGCAALSLAPADTKVLTVEYKVNFLAPARGDTIVATGRVLKSGRTLSVCQLDVDVIANGVATPCAVGQQTIMSISSRSA